MRVFSKEKFIAWSKEVGCSNEELQTALESLVNESDGLQVIDDLIVDRNGKWAGVLCTERREVDVLEQGFEKVSYDQYVNCVHDYDIFTKVEYDNIKLPKRATKGSAGYDFFAPQSFTLGVGQTIKIPTGIRVKLKPNKVLMCFPRSGQGFKYRLQLDNTVGVIDSDYYYSDNEGHMFAKITNDSREGKTLEVKQGEAFMQGIIMEYDITDDDDADGVRNGGFGSTSK